MHMLANITQQKFHFYSKKFKIVSAGNIIESTFSAAILIVSSGFRERHKRNIAKVTTARTAPKKKNLHNSLKLNAVKYCMGNMPKIISKQMTA